MNVSQLLNYIMSKNYLSTVLTKRHAFVGFGTNQSNMSNRMSRFPLLGKIVSHVFGTTNIGQYARAQVFGEILNKLSVSEFNNALDLGCGQGEYSLMLSQKYPHLAITALDIEPDRITKLKTLSGRLGLSNLDPHLGSMSTLNKSEHYDFIYSIDVFEHIDENAMPFEEALKKLRPGGLLLVKMPSRDQIEVLPRHWFAKHHAWLEEEHIGQVYMLGDLVKRVKHEGFEICNAFYSDGWLSRLSWELGYLTRKIGPPIQLLFLPVLKFLVQIDRSNSNHSRGNTIQVLARKPY